MAVVVDFPDWREQLRMILGEVDFRKSACQGSGLNPSISSAKITGSKAANFRLVSFRAEFVPSSDKESMKLSKLWLT